MIENEQQYSRSQALVKSLTEEIERLQNNEDAATARNRLILASMTDVKLEIIEEIMEYENDRKPENGIKV